MDKAGFRYDKILADEHPELAKQYGVKQAPTLIIQKGDGFEKIAGAGAIKAFVSESHIA
jgi:ribonucleoside-triphosphate reductase